MSSRHATDTEIAFRADMASEVYAVLYPVPAERLAALRDAFGDAVRAREIARSACRPVEYLAGVYAVAALKRATIRLITDLRP